MPFIGVGAWNFPSASPRLRLQQVPGFARFDGSAIIGGVSEPAQPTPESEAKKSRGFGSFVVWVSFVPIILLLGLCLWLYLHSLN